MQHNLSYDCNVYFEVQRYIGFWVVSTTVVTLDQARSEINKDRERDKALGINQEYRIIRCEWVKE